MQILLFPEAEAAGLQKLVWCQKVFARIPWPAWVELVTPYYESTVGDEITDCPLDAMLRIHFVQQYLGLSDPAMACILRDQALVRHLVGLPEEVDAVPSECALTGLRHVLESHHLTENDLDSMGVLSLQ